LIFPHSQPSRIVGAGQPYGRRQFAPTLAEAGISSKARSSKIHKAPRASETIHRDEIRLGEGRGAMAACVPAFAHRGSARGKLLALSGRLTGVAEPSRPPVG